MLNDFGQDSSKPDPLYFEKLGERFDEWMNPYDLKQRISLIKSLLPPSHGTFSCLEIGCGTGRVSEQLMGQFSQYVVSDVSEKLAKQTGDRLGQKWLCLNASKLSHLEESFDVVLSSECIEHTENPFHSIAEMAHLVKPGGSLIFTTPNRVWIPLLWVATKLRLRQFNGPEHWLFPHQAVAWLQKLGFSDIVISGCHLLPWQIPTASKWLPVFDRGGRWLFPLMINFGICARKPLMKSSG